MSLEQVRRKPLVIFIHGPTASGKTALALRAVHLFGGEIINCDSVQVFSSLNIGAAKPTQKELSKAPHHLLGHVPDGATYTAGEFRREAMSVIQKRSAQGVNLFFVVGGSGFYSQALIHGLFPVQASDPIVRSEIEKQIASGRSEELYRELVLRDPDYAEKIGSRDHYRLARALEILRSNSEITMESLKKSAQLRPAPFRYVQLGLNHLRWRLREKVQARTQKMLESGLIREVEQLISRGLRDWTPLRSVGYKESVDFIEGRVNHDQLADLIVQNTMKLAKRQMTWFRRDPLIAWFDTEYDELAPLIWIDEHLRSLDTPAVHFDTVRQEFKKEGL